MNIRKANKFDIPYFTHIVHKIHEQGDIGEFGITLDDQYLNSMFQVSMYGGIALIAERDDQPIGILTAIIAPNVWNDKVLVMNQLLLYVDEEHRYTRAGYLLLQEYDEMCRELVEQKRIQHYTINSAKTMDEIDFGRFGYENIASTWLKVGD